MCNTVSNAPVMRRLTDFAQVRTLYHTRLKKDFARNERKPLSAIQHLWDCNAYACYGLFDENEVLGYALFVRHENNYLLDYFATAEEHRDKGFGSIFFRQLAVLLADANCIVIEIEDPDQAKDEQTRILRERRLRFYLRSGCVETDLTAMVFGVGYRILEMPVTGAKRTEELRKIYTQIYDSMLPKFLFQTQFRTEIYIDTRT